MYLKHCKLGKNKQLELMKYFVAGATARTTADLAGIHRNTATRFFRRLRERIALKQHHRGEQFGGEVELDESYFGGARQGQAWSGGRRQGGCVRYFEARREGVYADRAGCQRERVDARDTAENKA